LIVSEQQAERISDEPGSINAGPAISHASDVQSGPVATPAAGSVNEPPDVGAPTLVPEQGAATEIDDPKAKAAKAKTLKSDAPNSSAASSDAPRAAGKVMIMSAGDRSWDRDGADAEPKTEPRKGVRGKRSLAALASVVVLATAAGALGGALAMASLSHFVGYEAAGAGANNAAGGANAAANNSALESAIARIEADMLSLKVSVEHTSKMAMSQYNKTSDRLDKLEKAQLEPAAKLAKLSEAVDKLRAAPPVAQAAVAAPVAPAPVAAKEVTGSIAPPAAAPASPPKVEIGRLPTVEGWVLRDVANGGALIEGRQGIYEVYAGDPVPGLGKIDAIRRQDGRWVVVTSRGLIVAR
jgi:hypothetical protein